MYLARELVHGDERLSLVLDGLGYTTGAGYQIWPNQAAFRLDLQVYIAGRIERASLAPLADRLSELGAEELSFDEYLLVVGDLYIDNFVASEGLYLALRFYAMGDDRPTEITEAMRNAHLRTDRDLEAVLQVAIERADRRLGEGHSMAQLTATVTALAEGFALRHRVGAEVEPVDLGARKHHPFSEALRAVVYQYTEDVAQRAG